LFEIEILNPLECRIKPTLASIIRPVVSYTAVAYIQGQYKKIRKEYRKSSMSKDDNYYYFYTGLLPKILAFCNQKNIQVSLKGKEEKLNFTGYSLKTISFREEQTRLIDAALTNQRGVLKAITGLGKTLLGLAIVSAFPEHKTLWLCHTKDLMYQSGKVAEKELGIKVGYIGDSQCDLSSSLTIATRQSFSKIAEEQGYLYDIIIIDECHHISKLDSEYATIMKNVIAPVRIGLTATLPSSEESLLAIESFLGPIIDEVSIEEGQSREIVAKIKIKFLKVPISHKIKEIKKYQDVYEYGVVKRFEAHKLIADEVVNQTSKNKSVLILVSRIEHGELLATEIKNAGVNVFFANGETETIVRTKAKDALNNKNILCVIATTIFREGINLPELDVIINAAGGKSEIGTLQAIGRGLRLTETKKELLLVDIIDLSNRYLVEHLAERLFIYSENNWL